MLFSLHKLRKYIIIAEFTFTCSIQFCSQIKRRFVNSSLKQRARTAHAYEFRRDFGQVLASQMVRHQLPVISIYSTLYFLSTTSALLMLIFALSKFCFDEMQSDWSQVFCSFHHTCDFNFTNLSLIQPTKHSMTCFSPRLYYLIW